jgi:hypothetical protein
MHFGAEVVLILVRQSKLRRLCEEFIETYANKQTRPTRASKSGRAHMEPDEAEPTAVLEDASRQGYIPIVLVCCVLLTIDIRLDMS